MARREETRRLLGATKTLPTPDTLPLIVTSLQEMVSLSGMQSSHFVPAAETRRGKEPHPSGTAPFPALPTISRRLVLLLSEQPWLSGMEFLNVTLPARFPHTRWGFGHVHATGQHAAALMKLIR